MVSRNVGFFNNLHCIVATGYMGGIRGASGVPWAIQCAFIARARHSDAGYITAVSRSGSTSTSTFIPERDVANV